MAGDGLGAGQRLVADLEFTSACIPALGRHDHPARIAWAGVRRSVSCSPHGVCGSQPEVLVEAHLADCLLHECCGGLCAQHVLVPCGHLAGAVGGYVGPTLSRLQPAAESRCGRPSACRVGACDIECGGVQGVGRPYSGVGHRLREVEACGKALAACSAVPGCLGAGAWRPTLATSRHCLLHGRPEAAP